LKHILIVSAVYLPEPVVSARISQDLATGLAEKNISVTVLAPYPSRPKGFIFNGAMAGKNNISIEDDGIFTTVRLPSFIYPNSNPLGRLYESISFGWHCYKFITQAVSDYDKVYMNTWPLFGQLGVTYACVKKKIPCIVHVQDIYPESLTNKLPFFFRGIFSSLLMPIERYVLKYANKIVAISQNMKATLVQTRQIEQDKISVVYNWQDDASFPDDQLSKKRQPKFNFMYLGNIGPVAGVDTLINSFQKSNLIDSCLTIAGTGSKKQECIQLAQRTPHLDIKFIDVPANSVAKTQAEADVLLLPVIKGGALSSIPSKLPAYMLSAKPILATVDNESDSAIAITEAKCGWVGNAEDTDWLANKMKEVSKYDRTYLVTLGHNGRCYCLKNFSKEVNLEKLINCVTNA